jgi:hypothetical protein
MSEHIATVWKVYQRECIQYYASPVQQEECRRAFYAGAATMFGLLTQVGEKSVSEDAGVRFFEEVQAELQVFARDMAQLARRADR